MHALCTRVFIGVYSVSNFFKGLGRDPQDIVRAAQHKSPLSYQPDPSRRYSGNNRAKNRAIISMSKSVRWKLGLNITNCLLLYRPPPVTVNHRINLPHQPHRLL